MLELLFPVVMTLPIIVLVILDDFHIKHIFIILASVTLWTLFMLWWSVWWKWRERNECKLKHQWAMEYVSIWEKSIYMCKSWEAYYKIDNTHE